MPKAAGRDRRGREPELAGQTVALIGGSSGIGLETARRAMAEGADAILIGRNQDRLDRAAQELGAQRTAAFDATDEDALAAFFRDLTAPIDHVMVTGGGPRYTPVLEMDSAQVRAVAHRSRDADGQRGQERRRQGPAGRHAAVHGRRRRPRRPRHRGLRPPPPPRCPRSRRPSRSRSRRSGSTSSRPASSTPRCRRRCSATDLDKRRAELRSTLPIGRVVGPADIAALAVHLMTNTAITGATYDIDGGQQYVS